MGKSFKRGSSKVAVKESTLRKMETREIRNIVTFRAKKNYGRFDSSFRNEKGHWQYLVSYSPSMAASLQVVRPILKESELPTRPPTEQGEIIELKMYYRNEEGKQMVKTYNVERDGFKSCYERWTNSWDKLLNDEL